MNRERALKVVLVLVGLLFTAGVIPLTMFFSREPAVPMIMGKNRGQMGLTPISGAA